MPLASESTCKTPNRKAVDDFRRSVLTPFFAEYAATALKAQVDQVSFVDDAASVLQAPRDSTKQPT